MRDCICNHSKRFAESTRDSAKIRTNDARRSQHLHPRERSRIPESATTRDAKTREYKPNRRSGPHPWEAEKAACNLTRHLRLNEKINSCSLVNLEGSVLESARTQELTLVEWGGSGNGFEKKKGHTIKAAAACVSLADTPIPSFWLGIQDRICATVHSYLLHVHHQNKRTSHMRSIPYRRQPLHVEKGNRVRYHARNEAVLFRQTYEEIGNERVHY